MRNNNNNTEMYNSPNAAARRRDVRVVRTADAVAAAVGDGDVDDAVIIIGIIVGLLGDDTGCCAGGC